MMPLPPAAAPAWVALNQVLRDSRPPCASDPDAFFDGDPDEASRLCVGCPARTPCAAYAEAADEQHGVWAGVDRSRLASVGRRAVGTNPPGGTPFDSKIDEDRRGGLPLTISESPIGGLRMEGG